MMMNSTMFVWIKRVKIGYYKNMKFKGGNRWKSTGGELRYKKWRTGVFQLNKGRKGLSRYYVWRIDGNRISR